MSYNKYIGKYTFLTILKNLNIHVEAGRKKKIVIICSKFLLLMQMNDILSKYKTERIEFEKI